MKNFNELLSLDLSDKIHTYKGFKHLPWVECLKLCKEYISEKITYFFDTTEWSPPNRNGDIFATVKVVVASPGEFEWRMSYPVIDGDIAVANPDSFRLQVAQQRAFVKCVAINSGLGLGLWEKELTSPEIANPESPGNLGVKIVNLFGELVPRFGDPKALHDEIGITEVELRDIVKSGSQKKQDEVLIKLQSYFSDDIPAPFDAPVPGVHMPSDDPVDTGTDPFGDPIPSADIDDKSFL